MHQIIQLKIYINVCNTVVELIELNDFLFDVIQQFSVSVKAHRLNVQIHDDWFFTGDYARYDTEGYIWFLGRKDDIIKSFGYRVSPYEIERVYKSHPDIADCAAIGEEIEKDKILVTAYIIPHANVSIDPNDLINFGKKHLAAYKAPKTIYLTKEFPRTKNGKILRKDINNSIAFAKSESQK